MRGQDREQLVKDFHGNPRIDLRRLAALRMLHGPAGLASATGGAVEARRGAANPRERRQAKQAGEKPPPVSRDNWLAFMLFLFAIVLLVVLAIAWIASRR
jgi:hypothetical protein